MRNDFTTPARVGTSTGGGRPTVTVYGDGDEIELRAGVEPIASLLDQRRHVVNKIAELRAVYGSFGTWDHTRKSELSRIKSLIRLQALKDNRKMNNDQVDEEAHEHPDYTRFVSLATKERAEYFRLEAQVEDIDFRINRGQALLRYVTSEPRV